MLFNKMRKGCFGSVLSSSYRDDIKDFIETFRDLEQFVEMQTEDKRKKAKLSVIWKVHIFTAHLEEFLSRKNVSLGRFAE